MTYKTVEVDIELSDFDDEDLIDELESRGKYSPTMGNSDELIDKIFHLRRQGKPYERELDEYLYIRTGRAI
jgi:hypothetical protein